MKVEIQWLNTSTNNSHGILVKTVSVRLSMQRGLGCSLLHITSYKSLNPHHVKTKIRSRETREARRPWKRQKGGNREMASSTTGSPHPRVRWIFSFPFLTCSSCRCNSDLEAQRTTGLWDELLPPHPCHLPDSRRR